MMPGDLYVNKYKKKKKSIKLSFQNNRLNTTNLPGELCKIGKDKINCIIKNIVLNWLICVNISNLHYFFFIGEAF